MANGHGEYGTNIQYITFPISCCCNGSYLKINDILNMYCFDNGFIFSCSLYCHGGVPDLGERE